MGRKTPSRQRSLCDAGLIKPWLAWWGILEQICPINVAPIGQKWLALYARPHLVSGGRLPREGCDLGEHGLPQLGQTLKDLGAGGCVWSRASHSVAQSLLKGGLGAESPCPPQVVTGGTYGENFYFKLGVVSDFRAPDLV